MSSTFNQWGRLEAYLKHGEVTPDNNAAEKTEPSTPMSLTIEINAFAMADGNIRVIQRADVYYEL